MTHRARSLLTLGMTGVLVAVAGGHGALALFSLALILWILAEWLRFQIRLRYQLPALECYRQVNEQSGPSGTVWAGRTLHVRVRITARRTISPPIQFRDVVPEIVELLPREKGVRRPLGEAPEGPVPGKRRLTPFSPPLPNEYRVDQGCRTLEWTYRLQARAAGRLHLPGIRLILDDAQGFFRVARFLPLEQRFRVLPDHAQAAESRPTVKRHNSLPTHGIHRLHRSGTGAELLDLREYVPGDPPKSIAWKASARRQQLMTRQYESEVPVRVRFFFDGSAPTRAGGFGLRLLDQINFVAASVARAATDVGDPISATMIDESGATQSPWFSGDAGLMRWLRCVAEFSERPPNVPAVWTSSLLSVAESICFERYPELMDRRCQRLPFTFLDTTRRRLRLAGVLAELFQLTIREHAEVCVDDRALATQVQRLCFESGLPWLSLPSRNYPRSSYESYAYAGPDIYDVLKTSLLGSIRRSKDNEVFVLLLEPYGFAKQLEHLLPAIKLAIGKHHRVAAVCPSTTFERPTKEVIRPTSDQTHDLLWVGEQARMRNLMEQLQKSLIRIGASVTFSGQTSAIRQVLDEMDLARDGKSNLRRIRL